MPIRNVVTRGYGNGNFNTTIGDIVTLGFTSNRLGTANVRNLLLASDLLSKNVGDRIYRVKLPDNPIYPCILYSSDEEPENTLSGSSWLVHKIYTFEIYGNNFVELEKISFELRSVLNNGPFRGVTVDNIDDQYFPEARMYALFIDVSVWQ